MTTHQLYAVPNLIDVLAPSKEFKRILSTSVKITASWLTDISFDVVAKLLLCFQFHLFHFSWKPTTTSVALEAGWAVRFPQKPSF